MVTGALTVVTPPAAEPISLADLKSHLRLDPADTTQDTLLGYYISAVRKHVEEIAGIAFLSQTLEWALDQFPWAEGPLHRVAGGGQGYWPGSHLSLWGDNPFGAIWLPRPPLASVASLVYLDPATGNPITMASSGYIVDTRSVPGRVVPAYGTRWPTTRWLPNAVVVQYVAGVASAAAIDPDLRSVLFLAAAALFEHREELVDGMAPADTQLLRRLLAPHRVWKTA